MLPILKCLFFLSEVYNLIYISDLGNLEQKGGRRECPQRLAVESAADSIAGLGCLDTVNILCGDHG